VTSYFYKVIITRGYTPHFVLAVMCSN